MKSKKHTSSYRLDLETRPTSSSRASVRTHRRSSSRKSTRDTTEASHRSTPKHKGADWKYVPIENLYVCSVCSATFEDDFHLKGHELSHGPTETPCNICRKVLSSPRKLEVR